MSTRALFHLTPGPRGLLGVFFLTRQAGTRQADLRASRQSPAPAKATRHSQFCGKTHYCCARRRKICVVATGIGVTLHTIVWAAEEEGCGAHGSGSCESFPGAFLSVLRGTRKSRFASATAL